MQCSDNVPMDKTGWARWLCVLPVVPSRSASALCAWIIGRFLSQALKS
jgi:hypothetical protein